MVPDMYTIVKGSTVLAETWEREERWVPFHDLVREEGTERSFARFPSEETAAPVAARFGGLAAEVLVSARRGVPGSRFEIVLSNPRRTLTTSGR